MENEQIQIAMAEKLVDIMEPDRAKQVLLQVVKGDDLYESILGDEKEKTPKRAPKVRRARSDKGKIRAINPGDNTSAHTGTVV